MDDQEKPPHRETVCRCGHAAKEHYGEACFHGWSQAPNAPKGCKCIKFRAARARPPLVAKPKHKLTKRYGAGP